jgi:hypothetical protein
MVTPGSGLFYCYKFQIQFISGQLVLSACSSDGQQIIEVRSSYSRSPLLPEFRSNEAQTSQQFFRIRSRWCLCQQIQVVPSQQIQWCPISRSSSASWCLDHPHICNDEQAILSFPGSEHHKDTVLWLAHEGHGRYYIIVWTEPVWNIIMFLNILMPIMSRKTRSGRPQSH